MPDNVNVERLQRGKLDTDVKVQAVIAARPSTQDSRLDPDEIVACLRRIVGLLHDDVRRQRDHLPALLRHSEARKHKVLLEIQTLALDTIAPLQPVSQKHDLGTVLASSANSPLGEATDRYLYRVAYFAMARLLLARIWEDAGFIDQTLRNGGFATWYAHYGCAIAQVVRQSFHFAAQRYSWLFGIDNNYTWYDPSDCVLVDVLYELSRYNLAGLNTDVLGAVYEEYLDTSERKNKGQYYTPRPVVGFIWDRVGLTAPQRQFRLEGGKRTHRIVLDFCTGSGGFLIEAARRVREAVLPTSLDLGDSTALAAVSMEDLNLALSAIIEGLRGSEITPFAYYLTEINLLIQLTPILYAMRQKAPHHVPFGEGHSLAVLHEDSLRLHNPLRLTLAEQESEETCRDDACNDIPSLSGFKKTVFDWLKCFRQADYVCSNPPYVGEKGHKDLFRKVRATLPYWCDFYQGKMDYSYWFIILGLSKLRDGGRLGYITTAYWPTADGATKLRDYILKNANIIEMIDFGPAKLFSDAPGQHNMVFVLERCTDQAARDGNRPKLVEVLREAEGESVEQRLTTLLTLIQRHVEIPEDGHYEDDVVRVFWSPVPQGSLTAEAWHLFHAASAEETLRQISEGKDTLNQVLEDAQGVVSGADRVKPKHFEHLSSEIVDEQGIKAGDGIFVLGEGELADLALSAEEKKFVKRTYKNSHVGRYVVDLGGDEPEYLLYLVHGRGFSQVATPRLYSHLSKFQEVLQRKRECQVLNSRSGQPRRQWYELHWPRSEGVFNQEKLVTSRRSPTNRFAWGPVGWYENSDLTVLTRRRGVKEGLKYFLALLNSAVIEYWFRYRSKRKGGQREYYSTPLQRIPIRRIRFSPETPEADRLSTLDQLRQRLDDGRFESAYELLAHARESGQEDVVHDALELIVDIVIRSSRDLAAFNECFEAPLSHLHASQPLPRLKPEALAARLPSEVDCVLESVGRLRERIRGAQEVIEQVVMDLYGIYEPATREAIRQRE